MPDIDNLKLLANIFNVTIDYLLFGFDVVDIDQMAKDTLRFIPGI